MFQAARKHLRSVAMLGVAAALVVGGVAAAQSDSGSGSGNGDARGSHPRGPGGPGGPGGFGPAMKGLTYAELHVQTKSGEAKVIRLDQGKIVAVDDSSITLKENDDSEVTIAVDEDTEVMGKPGEETSLSDFEAGQQVTVSGPDGGTAEAVMAMPKKGDLPKGGKLPPPPGTEQGSGE